MRNDQLLAIHELAGKTAGAPRGLLLAVLLDEAEVQPTEPVGRTHARLLRLHGQLASGPLTATAVCTDCEAVVEFAVDIADLCMLEAGIVDHPAPLQHDGELIRWRPASLSDLGAIDIESSHAASDLVARCLAEEHRPLAGELRAQVAQAMTEADPLAEIIVTVACPECGSGIDTLLDPFDFAWSHVDTRARELLSQVDLLARGYGWSERDILDLPAARRNHYVDLLIGDDL